MSQELEGTLTNSANLVGTFGSEGGGGTSNYNDLINKPSINNVTLQGNKTASQLGFANVATSGSYDDLSNKPTIPAAQVNSDWNASSGVAEILNKPTLSAVATSGDYDDLTNKPSIPAAQVNSDWNATSGVSEILNKPTVYQNAAELPVSSSDPTDTKSYIDTVVTSGSNTNGKWIKYADGTMICTKTIEFSVATSEWQAWGTCYETALKDCGVWAMNFISSPVVSATQTGGAAWLEYFYDTDNTNVGKTRFVRPTVPGATAIYKMNVIGVGRWKA